MDSLKMMKEQLTSCVQGQMSDMAHADAKELGEAVDMIKDLAEAIYYCTVTEAMEEKEKEPKRETYYYTEKMYPPMDYYRDMDRDYGRMYYDGGNGSGGNGGNMSGGSRSYTEYFYPSIPRISTEYPSTMMRDSREGKSPISRKMYMESKEMHKDQSVKMKDLEKYMQELSQDIIEMINDATPEEKQLLQQKISTLATKIK